MENHGAKTKHRRMARVVMENLQSEANGDQIFNSIACDKPSPFKFMSYLSNLHPISFYSRLLLYS